MYNGIGLTTPRGSGTNGYVIRNLSSLRSHEPAQDRQSAWDAAPPKHREPDEGILEHERKRKVEVKCLELQLQLEDEGIEEDKIEEQVGALREKLLANLASMGPPGGRIKASDTHALAAAKKAELSKMANAFGTRANYVEGDAFNREKQDEMRIQKQAEREERDRRRDADRARMEEQKARWEAEKKERDRLRRREEDRQRKEAEQRRRDAPMPPPPPPHDRGGPPPRRPADRRSRSRSPAPPRRARPVSRSPSPAPRSRRRFDSRSPSHSRSPSRSRSPPRRRRVSASPPRRNRSPPVRRDRSPPRRNRSPPPRRDRSPPRRERSPFRAAAPPPNKVDKSPPPPPLRARSASTGSSMSVSTGRSRSPTIRSAQRLRLGRGMSSAPAPPAPKTQELLDLSATYLLPVYARPDFVLSHGHGSYVYDTAGKRYLDFSAGIAVNALGHADAGVAQTIAEQAGKLLHTSNVYHNEWAPRLAELLVTLTQREGGLGFARGTAAGGGAKVFFSNSGTEANEGALKIARKVGKDRGGKTRIACFANAFHGRSMGALSVTPNAKYQTPFAPLLPGIDVGELNDAAGLDGLITDETCAVIVEPIQGEGGVNSASGEWLAAVRRRCDTVGAVLIFDEIQCGLFRTGTLWAHSSLPLECHPDVVTMAKPLANGYPIGAVLLRDSIAATMTAGTHGTTFGGSPLACAVGHHVLSRLAEAEMVAQIRATSVYLERRLEELAGRFPDVLEGNIRGRGLIRGLGFLDAGHPGSVVEMARARGIFVLTAGKNVVRLVPSLNVGREEVESAVEVLGGCIGEL
ncbi:pyridoxal phosphate-dependent transferase [Mycena belliarum]|uniref:acetylornithine transaminase n=1 Tax=Mycena belliarum TaxID=1033014 RepID=A0AAD6XTR4_9AGAR|nr:pyridoxal phosphate-dependent transferase [Mycena belliae]